MGRSPGTGSAEGPEPEGAPAGLAGAEASLLRQAGRGFVTGVMAAVVFALGVELLGVALTVVANGELMIVNGDATPLPVAFVAVTTFAVVVGALVGPVPGVLGGLAAGMATRRVRTIRALRLTVGLVGAAFATATVVVLGLLTDGLVPFLLGLAFPLPLLLPGVPFPYALSGGYVLAAAFGALVGALHAGWAASGPTSLTRPCGSLTCVPSLLLTRPR